MPGIVGFTLGTILENNPQQILAEMQALITHQDFYIKESLFCDRNVCATRSHKNVTQKQLQPYHELGIYVWLDGEFYNQDELIKHSVTEPQSDLAVLVSLFQQNSDFSFLRNIDGIYSAVIYDSLQKKVHLITDRYGLQHLYWTVHKGCLAWGSEVKSMLALPGFEPKIDAQAVEEFFGIGYLLEDRTWFEGVELLSSGTVLTWDIKEQSLQKQRYWWWDDIKPLTGKIDEDEIAEELGRLFIDAVERRSREGERVGIALSGGLDSRAILAAMPQRGYPIHAITFGQEGCEDIRIAEIVAKEKGVVHHIVDINSQNWLQNRLNCVWWTDGQLNLQHMHGNKALVKARDRDYYSINMNGFLGDAILGGSYYPVNNFKSVFHKVNNRGRRFINEGTRLSNIYLENRSPFFDNKLMEITVSIPEKIRRESYIYKKTLLKKFPLYFKNIPWQKTGFPISYPDFLVRTLKLNKKINNKFLSYLKIKITNNTNYDDYSNWIRQEPARSFFESVLCNPSALYSQYISQDNVDNCLIMHLNREKDWTEFLCLSLTFEIWLQQVFKSKYREKK